VCVIVFIKFTREIFMDQIDQINNTTIITTISIEINIIKLYWPCLDSLNCLITKILNTYVAYKILLRNNQFYIILLLLFRIDIS